MNMNKLINTIIIGFIVISTAINLYFIYNLDRLVNERLEVLDIEPEIIFLDSIEYDTVYLEKTEIVKLPIYKTDTIQTTDTIIVLDSVDVVVPIELKQFSDTLANTAISFDLKGFQCKVNNLYVENLKTSEIKENKVKRWGLGVGLGATYCDGFKILPTLGIYYKLF